MKKTLLVSLFFVLAAFIQTNAQSNYAYRQPASEKAIPKIVIDAFHQLNPFVDNQIWFVTHITYWQNDVSAGWYNDWYGNRTVVIYTYEQPTYFEVQFSRSPDELSRTIFNKYGYWYETRTLIKGLPMAVLETLLNSEYKDWSISTTMEKIESPGWPNEVYRFKISKKMKTKILRIDSKGNQVQSRSIE